jgi:hypothetical protein
MWALVVAAALAEQLVQMAQQELGDKVVVAAVQV